MSTAASNQELLRLLLEQSPSYAVILIDPRGKIVGINPGAEKILGFSGDQALGTSISEIFTPEDRALGLDVLERRIADSKLTSEDDRWHLRSDGSRFWGSGAVTALRNEQGELLGFGKVVRDRTDLKEKIDTLQRQLDATRTADRGKGIAIAKTAHELRNLLASFSVALDMLKGPTDDPDKRIHLVRLMSQQLILVHRLVEDLMDVERLHAGKVTLSKQRTSVQKMLRLTTEALQHRCSEKQLQLDIIAPEVPLWIDADPARLQQVFMNLLDNAIKYTPSGGRIWITASTEDVDVVIHFQDDGVGIPEAMLSRIFELFTQVRAQDATDQSGLGIGLALVKELVELHGGSVQAASNGAGHGSVFTVRLPLASLNSQHLNQGSS